MRLWRFVPTGLSARLQQFCASAGIPEAVALDLELAMVEAANNVIEHGYAGTEDGTLDMAFHSDGRQATVEPSDTGMPVPDGVFSDCRDIPIDEEGGRGILIMRTCVDGLEYRSEGGVNRLRLSKALVGT